MMGKENQFWPGVGPPIGPFTPLGPLKEAVSCVIESVVGRLA